MIATLNNTATSNVATATLADTLQSLFAELDLHLAGTAATGQTDLVIDQLDQWKNSGLFAGDCFTGITWTLGVEPAQR
jgi:hypothetical protein